MTFEQETLKLDQPVYFSFLYHVSDNRYLQTLLNQVNDVCNSLGFLKWNKEATEVYEGTCLALLGLFVTWKSSTDFSQYSTC